MARKMRGWLSIITSSTEVMPATAPTEMSSSAQGRPACLKASETGASMLSSVVADHAGQHGDHGDVEHRAEHRARR